MRQNGVRSNVRFPYSKGKSAKKQGYAAREDESLGMRTGKESTKKQSFKDRRDESYGKWGKRKAGKVNKQEFIMGIVGAALRGFGKALKKGKIASKKTPDKSKLDLAKSELKIAKTKLERTTKMAKDVKANTELFKQGSAFKKGTGKFGFNNPTGKK